MDDAEHEQPAWDRLMSDHVRRDAGFFHRLAQRIVGQPAAAEDACQQAFLKTWQQRQHVRDPERLRAYLAQVVVRESLQILRRRKRRQRTLEDQAHAAPSQAPMSEIQQLALRESLLLAMEELSDEVRLVVVLRLVQGLPGREVARMLGCSDAQVSRRLHRGMDQLRSRLRDWQPTAARLGSATPCEGVEP